MILTVILTPLVLQKELNDLKILAYILFTSVFCFILFTIIQMAGPDGDAHNADKHADPPHPGDYWKPGGYRFDSK